MNIKHSKSKLLFSLILGLGLSTGIESTTNNVKASTLRPETYTVKKGDNLWKIARKFKMPLQLLEDINGKTNNSLIFPDEKLKLNGTIEPVVASDTQQVQVSQEPVQEQQQPQQVQSNNNNDSNGNNLGQQQQAVNNSQCITNSAKEWIAQHESGSSYSAQNGRYYGKYQLDSSYLNGDYSPANQERVAQQYVNQRYNGSWEQAKAFWQAHGWY